uniref:Cullin family profile domain-containing protein n=1 Tax=Leptocylindrus danicus TaxID=163516 RepID=A0A7S2JV95_9STRA
MSNYNQPRIIQLEEGWNDQIKAKAIDVLIDILDNNFEGGRKGFDPGEYIPIYTTCYDMCTQRSPYNWSRDLYNRHGETIQNYLTRTVLPALRQENGIQLLKQLRVRWKNHVIMNNWLKKFFTYLDRYYVKHHSLPTLSEAGLRHFKIQVYDVIKSDACSAILDMVNQHREGSVIDKDLVKNIVELFEAMGMGNLEAYTADLEAALLTGTSEYYKRQCQQWIVTDSTPDYLIKTERALEEERARVADYLNSESEGKLLNCVENELLESVELELLEKEGSGCRFLLANDKSEDLQRMFNLFGRLEHGLEPMASIVQKYITSKGDECHTAREERLKVEKAKEQNVDPEFISALLELHQKYLNVIRTDFAGHALFQKALKDAFVDIVNRKTGKYSNAELMSGYCDRILKSGGGEKLSESEVEGKLDRIVQLFSYLTEKDLFAEIYRTQLSKRLLTGRSLSDDSEKFMIAKLKLQCGTQFTSKMEGMLGDLAVGSDYRSEFDARMRQDNFSTKLDFSVQVLTTGFWPSSKTVNVVPSTEMTKCMGEFKKWHDSKHAKRKLTYMFALGNATVRAVFGKKSYDIQVATLQAIVLDALNGGVTYTFTELAEKLNLEEAVLKPLMHSLSCGKFKVVKKEPSGSKINTTDTFMANPKFSASTRKFRIPMASLDATHNVKRVEEDRTHAIEASIVRTMKARKTLAHQSLVAEVLSQLAFFRPNAKTIKMAIASLIDRQYLERSADDNGVYNYLA